MNKLVVSAVIKDADNKVLAVHLNKEKSEGVWVMPGGKLEENETLRECVIRECNEELGIVIKPTTIAAIGEVDYGNNNFFVFVYYNADIISGTPLPQEDGKTLDAKFVELSSIHLVEKIKWL